MKANLGDLVKDKVTGFKGIIIAMSSHLYNCARVGVQAVMKKDGTMTDPQWFDIDSVVVLRRAAVKAPLKETGGPVPAGHTPKRDNPK